ncbi:MFS transporter [Roseibium sp.]|uniref:MFS transporter n=1 Tax=Roseibium sp. TaxID=1936156 RepID=UPI003A97D9AC
MPTPETKGGPGTPDLHFNPWLAAAVLLLANFMNLIDITIVNVGLPAIQAGLDASSTDLEWVSAGYVLTFSAGLLPFGRFGDLWGRHRVFQAGLIVFTLASVLCGFAPNIETLIVARLIQGVGAAMMVPQVLAIIHVIFPPEQKGKAFAMTGVITSLGAVAGPLIGGVLISADLWELGWRTIFLINLPIGALAIAGSFLLIPRIPAQAATRPDWLGILLFGGFSVCLVLPLVEGRDFGWPWWTFAMMGCALPFGIGFYFWQFYCDRPGRSALMPRSLLTSPAFLSGLGIATAHFSGIAGMFFLLAVFLQSGFGLSPLMSGLLTVPFPVGVMLASTFGARLGTKNKTVWMAAGAALMCAGFLALRIVVSSTGDEIISLSFVIPLLLCGMGMGAVVPTLFQSIMASVDNTSAGAGSGAMQAFQQAGTAFGIAVLGQIFFATLGVDGHAPGAASHAAFIQALETALIYPIVLYAAIAVFTLLRGRLRSVKSS